MPEVCITLQLWLVQLLVENGAILSSGDTALCVCIAVAENNSELLKDIIHYGGDVNGSLKRRNHSTA
jgi:potassium channel